MKWKTTLGSVVLLVLWPVAVLHAAGYVRIEHMGEEDYPIQTLCITDNAKRDAVLEKDSHGRVFEVEPGVIDSLGLFVAAEGVREKWANSGPNPATATYGTYRVSGLVSKQGVRIFGFIVPPAAAKKLFADIAARLPPNPQTRKLAEILHQRVKMVEAISPPKPKP